MLVLLRQADAEARGLRIYATIAGWGYSSDGKGGITRPEVAGHRLAIEPRLPAGGIRHRHRRLPGGPRHRHPGRRRHRAAGPSPRPAARLAPTRPPAAISTVKGNIGHTKAAAGVGGPDQGHPGRAPPGDPPGYQS